MNHTELTFNTRHWCSGFAKAVTLLYRVFSLELPSDRRVRRVIFPVYFYVVMLEKFPGKMIYVNTYSMLNMSQCPGRIYYPRWVNNILLELVPASGLPGTGTRGGGCQVVCWLECEQELLPWQFPGNLFMPILLQSWSQRWFLQSNIFLFFLRKKRTHAINHKK